MKSFCWSMAVAFGLLVNNTVSAGDLVIGHVSLHLGMPQTEALPELRKEFDLRQVSVAQGEFLLLTREPETRMRYSAGTVSFRDGKLYRASKAWATGGVKGRDTAEGLFGVLAELAGRDGKTCRIKAEALKAPPGDRGTDVKLVTIELPPDRRVLVKIYKPRPSSNGEPIEAEPDVDEYLVELPSSK